MLSIIPPDTMKVAVVVATISTLLIATAAVSANPVISQNSDTTIIQAEFLSSLIRGGAKTMRKLQPTYHQNENNNNNNNNYGATTTSSSSSSAVDLSSYSIRFEKCQLVKAYADDFAAAEATTAAATTAKDEEPAADKAKDELADEELAADPPQTTSQHHFVIFRLCPNNNDENDGGGTCSSSSCNENYGEYLMDMNDYLETTVAYFNDARQTMCSTCRGECGNREREYNDNNREENSNTRADNDRKLQQQNRQPVSAVDCDTCFDECEKIENMEVNGYYDATNFLTCQLIYDPKGDDTNSTEKPLWAAPICSNGGSRIKIGVFTDENCQVFDSTLEIDDYMVSTEGNAMRLSHALMKKTYMDTCISCRKPRNYARNNQGNDNRDEDTVNELCENLYNHAAKCEIANGFMDNGQDQQEQQVNDYLYEQLDQEELICEFLDSLKQSGTHEG